MPRAPVGDRKHSEVVNHNNYQSPVHRSFDEMATLSQIDLADDAGADAVSNIECMLMLNDLCNFLVETPLPTRLNIWKLHLRREGEKERKKSSSHLN